MAADEALIRMGPGFEQEWPGASAHATNITLNLLRLAGHLENVLVEALRPYGLTPAAAQVLSIIHGAGEPLPHHVIGERMVVRAGTVTWLVDGLEKRGLVQRLPHATSRRTVLVALTEEGEALMHLYRPTLHAIDRAAVRGLSEEEQEQLLALLGKVGPPMAE